MTIESLRIEYRKETRTTRRLMERIPADRFEWRPHPKSFTAGGLASHIVECVGSLETILTADECDINPSTVHPYQAASLDALLAAFDEKVTNGTHTFWSVSMNRP